MERGAPSRDLVGKRRLQEDFRLRIPAKLKSHDVRLCFVVAFSVNERRSVVREVSQVLGIVAYGQLLRDARSIAGFPKRFRLVTVRHCPIVVNCLRKDRWTKTAASASPESSALLISEKNRDLM